MVLSFFCNFGAPTVKCNRLSVVITVGRYTRAFAAAVKPPIHCISRAKNYFELLKCYYYPRGALGCPRLFRGELAEPGVGTRENERRLWRKLELPRCEECDAGVDEQDSAVTEAEPPAF